MEQASILQLCHIGRSASARLRHLGDYLTYVMNRSCNSQRQAHNWSSKHKTTYIHEHFWNISRLITLDRYEFCRRSIGSVKRETRTPAASCHNPWSVCEFENNLSYWCLERYRLPVDTYSKGRWRAECESSSHEQFRIKQGCKIAHLFKTAGHGRESYREHFLKTTRDSSSGFRSPIAVIWWHYGGII